MFSDNLGMPGPAPDLSIIPERPAVYDQLERELSGPGSSARGVTGIIEHDEVLTHRTMQIANSAYFAQRRQIADTQTAVEVVGVDTVCALALGLGVFSRLESAGMGRLYSVMWHHAMKVAAAARKIAQIEGHHDEGTAFAAGLLHDVGKVVLAINFAETFDTAVQITKSGRVSAEDAERSVFGTTHSAAGAFLLNAWRIPDQIVQAVAHHHSPLQGARGFSSVSAVHIADGLIKALETGSANICEYLDRTYMLCLGAEERIPLWIEACGEIH